MWWIRARRFLRRIKLERALPLAVLNRGTLSYPAIRRQLHFGSAERKLGSQGGSPAPRRCPGNVCAIGLSACLTLPTVISKPVGGGLGLRGWLSCCWPFALSPRLTQDRIAACRGFLGLVSLGFRQGFGPIQLLLLVWLVGFRSGLRRFPGSGRSTAGWLALHEAGGRRRWLREGR